MAPPHLAPFTEAGGLLFLSGQLAFGPDGRIAEPGIAGQTEQVLANIRSVLEKEGLALSDVVSATVWLTQAADFPAFNDTYARIFGDHRPARSTVISGLVLPQAVVEIAVVARRPA
jgi:2-iminobutanoate/2-iminopropanoate deaminase